MGQLSLNFLVCARRVVSLLAIFKGREEEEEDGMTRTGFVTATAMLHFHSFILPLPRLQPSSSTPKP